MAQNHNPILCCCEGTGYCCIKYSVPVTCQRAGRGENCDVELLEPEIVEVIQSIIVARATEDVCSCENATVPGTCISATFYNTYQEALDNCNERQYAVQGYTCGWCGPIPDGCCVYSEGQPVPSCATIPECDPDPCCDPQIELCCRTTFGTRADNSECIQRTCVLCSEEPVPNSEYTPITSCTECVNDYVTITSPCCPSCFCGCCDNPPCDCTNDPQGSVYLCPDCSNNGTADDDPPACFQCGTYPGCVTTDQNGDPTCTTKKCFGPCDADEADPRPLCSCGPLIIEPGCAVAFNAQNAQYNEDFTKGLVTDTTGVRLNSIFLFGYGSQHL